MKRLPAYEEIAAPGGGSLDVAANTPARARLELLALALPRIDALIAQGVARVEIKSAMARHRDRIEECCASARALGRERPDHRGDQPS